MKRSLKPLLRPYVCQSCRHKLARSRRRGVSTSRSSKPELYDIVTVGGGPVGLSLLAALKSSPTTSHLKIALLDAHDLGQSRQWKLPPDQYSNRASSLTPSSIGFLEEIGVWDHVDKARIQPYDKMKVWDAGNDASLQFDHRDEAVRYSAPQRIVATMTENANLTKGLLDRIAELQNESESSLLPSTKVESIQNGTDDPDGVNLSTWPTLTISESSRTPSRTIAPRLLIGADGFNSPVRAFAGIASNGWDYNLHGVVATLKLEPCEESTNSFSSEPPSTATAYQRFIPALGGPIALLPLPDNHASLVWSTTPQHAAYLKTLPQASLVAMLNAAFRLSEPDLQYMLALPPPSEHPNTPTFTHADELTWRLRHTPLHPHTPTPPLISSIQPTTLASFPLRLRHAHTYISPRCALVGDAAHTIHPLAGQGLNLGLADARALAHSIGYAVQHGQDLGDILTLERYNAERWGANAKVAGACDLLGKVYGVQGGLAGAVRGWGMGVLDQGWVPGLKGWVMRQAEG